MDNYCKSTLFHFVKDLSIFKNTIEPRFIPWKVRLEIHETPIISVLWGIAALQSFCVLVHFLPLL